MASERDDGFGDSATGVRYCGDPGGSTTTVDGDCDDSEALAFPGNVEVCDGFDNDCDGEVDNGFGPVSCGLGVCMVTVDACVDGQPQECVPGLGSFFEECDDGLDNNCNGAVDEDCGDPQ